MIKFTLYVSRASLPPGRTTAAMRDLVREARQRNQSLDLTGALIFTGDHFAQLLEGPAGHVDMVTASIMRDRRHSAMRSFQEESRARRLFPEWSLAYDGPSTYVDQRIRALFEAEHDDLPGARADLLHLLQSLTLASKP